MKHVAVLVLAVMLAASTSCAEGEAEKGPEVTVDGTDVAAVADADPFRDVHMTWADLEAFGGLAVQGPYRDATTRWILGIDCNVAGEREISAAPSKHDDNLGVRRVSAELEAGEPGRIVIWVLTAPPRDGRADPECRGAFLGHPPPGAYTVAYREPSGQVRQIGQAEIPDYRPWLPGQPRPPVGP